MLKRKFDMNKSEYLEKINTLRSKVGMWDIMIKKETNAPFVMGYYHNVETKKYDVYINNERGKRRVRLTTVDEEEALEKLLDMIEFEIEEIGGVFSRL